jgi:hypothetical protein
MRRTARAIEERFWDSRNIDFSESCWRWLRATDHHGYGHLTVGGKRVIAHRLAYELANGPIPTGMSIDHICHNTSCVQPDHLRVVTHKQNMENRVGAHKNSSTGIRGVSWHKHAGKWQARISHNNKSICVGYFDDIHEADAAVTAKRNELYTHNDVDRNGGAA